MASLKLNQKQRANFLVIIMVLPFLIYQNNVAFSGNATESQSTQKAIGRTESKCPWFLAHRTIEYGRINKDETKNKEVKLLFPNVGSFYIFAVPVSHDGEKWMEYNRTGVNGLRVDVSKNKEAEIHKLTARECNEYKGNLLRKGVKMTGPPASVGPAGQLSDFDTTRTNIDTVFHVAPNPEIPPQAHETKSYLLLNMRISPNPKINQPARLIISITSEMDFDSAAVNLSVQDSVVVIEPDQGGK